MALSAVIEDVTENPHRSRGFYEYPELYDFYHSRTLDRDAQVGLLKRFQPDDTSRVLEFGCGTGPLLARIEGEYEELLGVELDPGMREVAEERTRRAEVRGADFTSWSAAEEDRVFDVAVLMGGLLHITDDGSLAALAENAHDSLRDGGAFLTFFRPLDGDVDNGSRDVRIVESDRYTVERHSVSALTSSEGNYTTTYLFVVRDESRDREAKMGTVVEGKFHDPADLETEFASAGFGEVEVVDGDGPTVLHAVK
jgi:SAM-dependent methyltransferase